MGKDRLLHFIIVRLGDARAVLGYLGLESDLKGMLGQLGIDGDEFSQTIAVTKK